MRLINLFEYWTVSACCVQPAAVKLRSTGANGGSPNEVSEKKQKKSDDQQAPVTRYEVLFGVESYNNDNYQVPSFKIPTDIASSLGNI